MRGEEHGVLDAEPRTLEVGTEFGLFNKLRTCFIAPCSQLVCDLLGTAFLFKELSFYFARPSFGFGCSSGIADYRFDDRRVLDQQLLVKRDEFEQQPILGLSGKSS